MTQINKPSRRVPRTPRDAVACCSPVDTALDAAFFKSLSDPTRLVLLSCLVKCKRPCNVSELSECCNVDLSVVSRHLAYLERARVIEAQKNGRVVSYSVRHAELVKKFQGIAAAFEIDSTPMSGKSCCVK